MYTYIYIGFEREQTRVSQMGHAIPRATDTQKLTLMLQTQLCKAFTKYNLKVIYKIDAAYTSWPSIQQI